MVRKALGASGIVAPVRIAAAHLRGESMKRRTRTSKVLVRPMRSDALAVVSKPKVKAKTSIVVGSKSKGISSVAVYLAGLGSDKSRASIYDSLKRVIKLMGSSVSVAEFPWERIGYEEMKAIRSRLIESKKSPNTINHTLCAVRGVLEVAWNQGKISTDDYHRARSVKGVKGSRTQTGRHIKKHEILKLFAACGRGVVGARNAGVLSVLVGCGMRRAEVAEAPLSAVDMDEKTIRVIGKGNKERLLHMPKGTALALGVWLEARGDAPGPLFLSLDRYGGVTIKGISDETIRKIVRQLEKRAGVKHITPHDFRRTNFGNLLDAGVDIVTVQRIAGHSSPNTTAKYDRRGEETKKKAADLLDVPYVADNVSKVGKDSVANRHEEDD